MKNRILTLKVTLTDIELSPLFYRKLFLIKKKKQDRGKI